MIKGFEFQEGGRDYACTVEQQFGQDGEHWWWFNVSGDGQRYAPFSASRDDTRTSVQKRIVQFYEHRLWVRAQPVQRGAQFGSRPAAATPKPAPAAAAAPAAPVKKAATKPAAKSATKAAKKPAAKASAKKRSAARA